MKIYRDDDINYLTPLDEFRRIHQPFAERGVMHSVGVEMAHLWENHSLFYFLATDPHIEVALHGWRHEDYSTWPRERTADEFRDAIAYWNENVGRLFHGAVPDSKKIRYHYPTWDRVSDPLIEACRDVGLYVPVPSAFAWRFHWWEVTPADVTDVLDGRTTPDAVKTAVKNRRNAILKAKQ